MAKRRANVGDRLRAEDTDLILTVRAAQQGDQEAFGELIEQHEMAVFMIAYQWLGNHVAARQLCEEVFIDALRQINELQDPGSFGRWLESIVRRKATGRVVEPMPLVAKSDVFQATSLKGQGSLADSAPNDSARHPRLDLFAHGPLLEIIDQFREHLLEKASGIAGDLPIDANHLEEAYKALLPDDSNVNWPAINRRRVDLIRKKVRGDISASEQNLLHALQAAADRYLAEVAPRPLDELRRLEEELQQRAAAPEQRDQHRDDQ